MRKLVAALFVLITVVAALLGLAVYYIDSIIAYNEHSIIAAAEKITGRKVAFDRIDVKLLGGIGVRVRNLSIPEDPAFGKGDFLRAPEVRVNLRIHLLRREVSATRIVLHQPVTQVIRNPQGLYNFGKPGMFAHRSAPPQGTSAKAGEAIHRDERKSEPDMAVRTAGWFPSWIFGQDEQTSEPSRLVDLLTWINPKPTIERLEVLGGTLHYLDYRDPAKPLRVRLGRWDLHMDHLSGYRHRPVKAVLAAAFQSERQNIRFDGVIGPLGLTPRIDTVPVNGSVDIHTLSWKSIREIFPQMAEAWPETLNFTGTLRGKAHLHKGSLKEWKVEGTLDLADTGFKHGDALNKPRNDPLRLDVDARVTPEGIAARRLDVTLEKLSIRGKGELDFGSPVDLDLSLEVSETEMGGLSRWVPLLADYGLAGRAEATAQVTGELGGEAMPRISGAATLRDASMSWEPLRKALPWTAEAWPEPLELTGTLRSKELSLDGSLEEWQVAGTLDLTDTGFRHGDALNKPRSDPLRLDVDARVTPGGIHARQLDVTLDELSIKGEGDLDFGSPVALDLSLEVSETEMGGLSRWVPLLADYDLSGRAGATAQVTGELGGEAMPWISGTATLREASTSWKSLRQAFPGMAEAWPKAPDLTGTLRSKELSLKGNPREWKVAGTLDLTDTGFRHGDAVNKPRKDPLLLDVDASVTPGGIHARRLDVTLDELSLKGRGDLKPGSPVELDLELEMSETGLGGLSRWVPLLADYGLSGRAAASAHVTGELGGRTVPLISGTATLREASVKTPAFEHPLEAISAAVEFTNHRATFRQLSLSIGQTRLAGEAQVESFAPFVLNYRLASPSLRLADLGLQHDHAVLEDARGGGRTVRGGPANLDLTAARGTLPGLELTDLTARFDMTGPWLSMKALRFNSLGGSVDANGRIRIGDASPRFEVKARLEGIEVREDLVDIDGFPKVEGTIHADLDATGRGRTWDAIKPTLGGTGTVTVVNGRFLDVNSAEPEYTEFEQLHAAIEAKGSRIVVESIDVKAQDYEIAGEGWIKLDGDANLDGVLTDLRRQREVEFTLRGTLPDLRPQRQRQLIPTLVEETVGRAGQGLLDLIPGVRAKDSAKAGEKPEEKDKGSLLDAVTDPIGEIIERARNVFGSEQ